MLARSNSRLFRPVSGRTMVINLINEIRLIEWDYLKRRFNWVYTQEIHHGDLRTAFEVLAAWEKESRTTYYAWWASSWIFSSYLSKELINDLRQLYQISKNIENKYDQLNHELTTLKAYIGDTEQFEKQVEKIKIARRNLVAEIEFNYDIINIKIRALKEILSLHIKHQEIKWIVYENKDGTERKLEVDAFDSDSNYDCQTSSLAEQLENRVLNGDYKLDRVTRYLKAEINAEIADYQKLSDHLVQKVHDTVTPVKSDNIRLTTEFLHKDSELSAAKTKIKLLTEESEKSQKYAASLANDLLAKQREADKDAVNKRTSLMSEHQPTLRSRRK